MSRKLTLTVLGVVALALILVSGVSVAGTPLATRPNSTPLPPTPDWEEERKALEEIKRRMAPTAIKISEITRGSVIHLGEREIQLPDDAYVEMVGHVDCPVGIPCPRGSLLVGIRRGNSFISVERKTGEVVHIEYAPGEEHIFDFLLEVLP